MPVLAILIQGPAKRALRTLACWANAESDENRGTIFFSLANPHTLHENIATNKFSS